MPESTVDHAAPAGVTVRAPGGGSRARDWFALVRPAQWTKNGFVLAPLLFGGRAGQLDDVGRALAAFAAFCLAASSVYVLNDLADRALDQAHPAKRQRPIAAGRIQPGAARVGSALLALAGLALAATVNLSVATAIATYVVLNVGYSLWLKHVVILDVFVIAGCFLLRLLAGAAAVAVRPSVWLLVCGGLLALYLGFAKRRHELVRLGAESSAHRSVLTHYSTPFLDQMSAVLLAVTVVAYIMYTLTSETAQRVGGDTLVYSTPFVLYGVFRYLYLVHQREMGTPTEAVLADRPLVASVVLWGLYCAWVLYRPR
jgi:4-hydroxybenzoate polyprenyltransferase